MESLEVNDFVNLPEPTCPYQLQNLVPLIDYRPIQLREVAPALFEGQLHLQLLDVPLLVELDCLYLELLQVLLEDALSETGTLHCLPIDPVLPLLLGPPLLA